MIAGSRKFASLFWLYNLSMSHTPSLENILEILRNQIPMLAERYSVETLEIFGSYVRAEQKKDSDLDVLVTFKEVPSLLTFIAIENYLPDLLGIRVDLVMRDSLKPKIGEQILGEAILVRNENQMHGSGMGWRSDARRQWENDRVDAI